MKSMMLVLWIVLACLAPLSLNESIPFRSVPYALSAPQPSLSGPMATEQEVKGFFDQYIERYNEMDIEGFLLFFSLKAKQNQRYTLPEIRAIYTDLFNRSRSLQLSIEEMRMKISPDSAEIKAGFTVNQVLREGREEKVWKGDVRWVLVREDDKLQILSIDYQYSVPPPPAGGKVPGLPPLLAKEEEVEQFFSDYIDRYHQRDVDGFLSLFSSKAVQNQKEGLEGIRSIYTKFFEESKDLRYQVEGKKSEIYQNRVEVKARFRVDQTLKKGNREKVWSGTIRWVLGREDGVLKIITLDYQNEASP